MTAPTQSLAPATAQLVFDVTVADFEAFNLHHGHMSGRRAKRWRNNAVFMLVMAAMLTAYYAYREFPGDTADLPLLYGVPLGFAATVLLAFEGLRPWFIRWQIRTMLGRAPRDAFLGPKRLEANAEGLTVTAETNTTHCAWAAITATEETATHIFLMLGNASGIIIPKHAQPEAALSALRDLVAAHIGAAAMPGP